MHDQITFADLEILVALRFAEEEISRRVSEGEDIPSFGSDEWGTDERIGEFIQIVDAYREHQDRDYYRRIHKTYRKSAKNKQRIVAALAARGSRSCFYGNRGLGECVATIDLDRIVAGEEYSEANCLIACSFHNRSRGNRSIEEYLRSGRGLETNQEQPPT